MKSRTQHLFKRKYFIDKLNEIKLQPYSEIEQLRCVCYIEMIEWSLDESIEPNKLLTNIIEK